MSFGFTALAQAQTVSAGDQATLQQQLQLMKAKLQLLELQQGQAAATAEPSVTEAPTPAAQQTANISATDAAALNAALSSLATTLVSLENAMQSNPQFLAENGPVIAKSLSGIESSLAAVLVSMQNGAGSALAQNEAPGANSATGIAANPSDVAAPSTEGGAQDLNQGSLLPSVQDLSQNGQGANAAENTQGAAVASSIFGGNRLPAIIIGIILLAMVAILIWGRGGSDELAAASAGKGGSKKKAAPVSAPVQPTVSFVSNHSPAPNATPATASPLANTLNQSQQQRKSA